MSVVAIKAKIVEKLGDLADIQEVYNWGIDLNKAEIAAYPVAVVLPTDSSNDMLSMGDNLTSYNFAVYLFSRVEAVDEQAGQNELEDLVDQVVGLFANNADNDLDGTVSWTAPPTWKFYRSQFSNSQMALIAEVTLQCKVPVNIQ